MRAILRADDQSSLLWIDSGERFELPELTDPQTIARRAAARKQPARARTVEPTGPTDEGGPGARAAARAGRAARPSRSAGPTASSGEDASDDLATDESPRPPLRLVRSSPVPPVKGIAPDSLPPLGALERERAELEARLPAGVSRQFARLDDEMSTGLFEPMAWDEADPCSVVPEAVVSASMPRPPRAAEPAPVRTRVAPAEAKTRAVPAPERPAPTPPTAPPPEDFSGIVALPLSPPPRPAGAEFVLPGPRPIAARPEWWDEERNDTRVILDPTRRVSTVGAWGFWTCVAMDLAAWAAGFVVTFGVGGIVSATALGVAVAVG